MGLTGRSLSGGLGVSPNYSSLYFSHPFPTSWGEGQGVRGLASTDNRVNIPPLCIDLV